MANSRTNAKLNEKPKNDGGIYGPVVFNGPCRNAERSKVCNVEVRIEW